MASNNDPTVIPMIERHPCDLAETNTSDPKTLTGEAVLSFHNISYRETVQRGFLLRKKTSIETLWNINGIMKPGLNAIMGPQDGSRSLFLDVLAARRDPRGLSGDILINGKHRPANFKCSSGYVPRNDVVLDTVTVRENLEFSAALRLPMTITRDEKRRRINEVLELLHLDKEEQKSKPRSKELKKRTRIAMELVTEHPILFLDDPTTGLDLKTTTDIISVLRRVSEKGRTIIFSINQPQYSIFSVFDSLTLVASGKLMFHGPAQDALGYFKSGGYKYENHDNPADFFLDIINGGFSAILGTKEDGHDVDKYEELCKRQSQITRKLANMYTQSTLYRETRTKLDQLLGKQKLERVLAVETTCITPLWHQLGWIIYRSFKNLMVHPQDTVKQVVITVILAAAVGITFHVIKDDCVEVQMRASLLYVLSIFQCTTRVSIGELFMLDRARFLHEHTSGYYRVSSYFFGKLLAELIPRRLLPSTIFTLITCIITGIETSMNCFFTMICTAMMLAYAASSLSLSIGAGKNAEAVPTQLVTIYFVFMLFFSGLSLYSGSFLPTLSWIQYFNILHYGFKALMHNEFLGQNFCPEHNTEEVSTCPDYVICTGEEFLMTQGIDLSSWGFWENYLALVYITIILLTITYVRLYRLTY
ncbi:ATP-binding cassette sub-family G member 3-like [Arvicanthis niloticus]|uniref:ATP-binding cassette sub-family G member 3-like n=1 Tax=Arvicanthis niloticus TaxID=61156 RepID=UPI001485E67E|nr:ATP-binding cassette sub-family G member 3-like [Arvicanthis niloticus]